jgi:LysM repeat protein
LAFGACEILGYLGKFYAVESSILGKTILSGGRFTMKEYTVQHGDTLPSIAAATLGNSNRWDEISRLNNLVGPVQLFVGQKLRLPDSAYTCSAPPKPGYFSSAPPPPNMCVNHQKAADMALGRGFMFVVFEQLPEVGTGKIIRKVALIPRDFSFKPANPFGSLSPAEHALNLNPSQSQFLSGSNKAFGAPSMNGTPVLLDVAKIEAAGGKVMSLAELVADLERFATQNPSAKVQVERLLWAIKKVEGEVLVTGGTPPGSGAKLSTPHTAYVKSAEDLWQAFTSNKISKAELEQGLMKLEQAYSKAKVVGKVGRVLTVVGVVFTVADLGIATKKSIDQNSFKPIGAETVRQVGGWGGALAGAKIGAIGGAAVGIETGPGAIVTGAIGAIIFGAAGYFGADWVADHISPN